MTPTAHAVLVRASQGDKAAMREAVVQHGWIVWGLARRMSPTRLDAEDAAEEIFLDLWTHGGRHDPARASEEAFVALIARRRLIDRRRRGQRRPGTVAIEELVEEPADLDLEEAWFDRGLETKTEAALAARAMRDLRPEPREVLRLLVAKGLTHEEIAIRTGIPPGTVKDHTRRGLIGIRRLLLGEPEEAAGLEEGVG